MASEIDPITVIGEVSDTLPLTRGGLGGVGLGEGVAGITTSGGETKFL